MKPSNNVQQLLLMEIYNQGLRQDQVLTNLTSIPNHVNLQKNIDHQLYNDQNSNPNAQCTSSQTITWGNPLGTAPTENSFQPVAEYIHQDHFGSSFVLMTPEQHATYLNTLYPTPSTSFLLGDAFQPYHQVQNGYNQVQYVNYTTHTSPTPLADPPEASIEEAKQVEPEVESEDITPIQQHELLKQAVQKFQLSNKFKTGGDGKGSDQESSKPFLTSEQLSTLMSEFPQLVAQPSSSPLVSNPSQLSIKVPDEPQTPLQRLAALVPPSPPSRLPQKSSGTIRNRRAIRKPSVSRPPTLSPQVTCNELLEDSPMISPVSSEDSWAPSFQQISTMPCPFPPSTFDQSQDSEEGNEGDGPPMLRRFSEPSKSSKNPPYARANSIPKRYIPKLAKAGRQEKCQRPVINFLDATGLEAEIGSHQEMEVAKVMQLIAEFMAKNEISRLQVAHMTDTNSFYISWFLEGKHDDLHPDCKLIFITWYLNCYRFPEKLEEYMSYPTIQPSIDMSFSKAQQDMMMREFRKEEKVNVAKLVEDVNKKVPRTIKSATMTPKLVMNWYRALTSKKREKMNLQSFPKLTHHMLSSPNSVV